MTWDHCWIDDWISSSCWSCWIWSRHFWWCTSLANEINLKLMGVILLRNYFVTYLLTNLMISLKVNIILFHLGDYLCWWSHISWSGLIHNFSWISKNEILTFWYFHLTFIWPVYLSVRCLVWKFEFWNFQMCYLELIDLSFASESAWEYVAWIRTNIRTLLVSRMRLLSLMWFQGHHF